MKYYVSHRPTVVHRDYNFHWHFMYFYFCRMCFLKQDFVRLGSIILLHWHLFWSVDFHHRRNKKRYNIVRLSPRPLHLWLQTITWYKSMMISSVEQPWAPIKTTTADGTSFFITPVTHLPPPMLSLSPAFLFVFVLSLSLIFLSLSFLSGLSSSLHDELMANKQTLAPVFSRLRGHGAAGQNSKVAISLSAWSLCNAYSPHFTSSNTAFESEMIAA